MTAPRRALVLMGVCLLAAAGVLHLDQLHTAHEARRAAQALLEGADPPPEAPAAGASEAPTVGLSAPAGGTGAPEAAVMGILYFPTLGMELPVLDRASEELLRRSPCRYGGVQSAGEAGNLIVAGHNFQDGVHFADLQKLVFGDDVFLVAPEGAVYSYRVWESEWIDPGQITRLRRELAERTLTLFTCDNTGKRRYILRCRGNDP